VNTFERHFQRFPELLQNILAWEPDFVVPVAKKGGKLLRLVDHTPATLPAERVRYRQFFVFNDFPLIGKRIAILDDATQYTATLYEYRSFFERRGAEVRTFSLVGHDGLSDGTHWQYDQAATIATYLPDPVYQEYIVQESRHLLANGNHFDLDHVVFECSCNSNQLGTLASTLARFGSLSELSDHCLPSELKRFVLSDFKPFVSTPYLRHSSILPAPFTKLKFVFDGRANKLALAPMMFPSWHYAGASLLPEHFADVPFSLPFHLDPLVDEFDQSLLFRYYCSIYLVYAVSLVKALVQAIEAECPAPSPLRLRQRDLRATFGDAAAERMLTSIETFISDGTVWDFGSPAPKSERQRYRHLDLPDCASLIHHLRSSYESQIERRQTRVSVHYALSYDSLVANYQDLGNLGADLDYYCDLGVLVPDIVRTRGYIRRGIRSGELNGQYDWARTGLLVPIAIDQFSETPGAGTSHIDATALVKVLANFVYDYPTELNSDLHNFVTEPYLFGAFVRVYHYLRALSRPSLYESDKVSEFYQYNRTQKRFEVRHRQKLAKEVGKYFDDRLEVPYSELAAYFRLMGKIARYFKGTDVLNMLSICRDDPYFYRHVHFNTTLSFEEATRLVGARSAQAGRTVLSHLDDQIQSATTKLALFAARDSYMARIDQRFGHDLDSVVPLGRLKRHRSAPSESFKTTLATLETVLDAEKIFAAAFRHALDRDPKAWGIVQRAHADGWHEKWGVPSPQDAAVDRFGDSRLAEFGQTFLAVVSRKVTTLEEPSQGLESRLRIESERKARNVAAEHAKRTTAKHIALLYADFSGLRTLAEPKSEVLGSYYLLVERIVKKRGGVKLYGGMGGDDAFTIAFHDPEAALQCAREVKMRFGDDLFLRSSGDVKFGLAGTSELPFISETNVVRCWGRAKDCCELKTSTIRNRGDLLVDDETYDWIGLRSPQAAQQFDRIDDSGRTYWKYRAIEPFQT